MSKGIAGLSNDELSSTAGTAYAAAAASPTDYGLTTFQVTTMQNNLNNFDTGDALIETKKAELAAAYAAQKGLRQIVVDDVRSLRDHATSAHSTEEQVAALGLPSAGEPTTDTGVPVGVVDTSVRQRHTLSWSDSNSPDSKRRPHNARSCEIWAKIDGPPPTDVSECSFVVDDTASPYEIIYSGAEGGKTIHYLLRWHFKDGTFSGWSDTVSATVTA